MSSGSFKELIKVVNAYIPTIDLPLPEDLIQVIQAYLDKHLPIDESDASRLQDELINIYQKEVKDKPQRYPIFIAILRQLRPTFTGSQRLQQWWDMMLAPVLAHLTEEKGLAEEVRGILLETLACDVDEESDSQAAKSSADLSYKLLDMWLTRSPFVFSDTDSPARFLVEQINSVLMDYGKKRPKDFLITADKFFVKKEHRTQLLTFLCEFIRHGPPHLHEVLQTPLFEHLLQCLQTDTSTTVISLALTALTMFLPHIPNDIATHLPSLFTIYGRILFWDRERTISPDTPSEPKDPEKQLFHDQAWPKISPKWERLSYSPETDEEVVPELLHYFSFLYGLYPINLMSYIRKPERYLRHANFQGDDIEVQPSEIRQRSEPFCQVHLLHPNFFSMTIETELTDPNRWMRSEASDVVASCMALCGPLYPGLNGISRPSISVKSPDAADPPPAAESNVGVPYRPLLDVAMEEPAETRQGSVAALNASWRNTTSTAVESQAGSRRQSGAERQVPYIKYLPLADSPTLGPLELAAEGSNISPTFLISDSHEKDEHVQMVRGGLQQALPNESEISLISSQQRELSIADSYLQSLEHRHQMPPSPHSQTSPVGDGTDITSLRREIKLLKNELNFERYLKQQHLSHIGQLRRKQVREAQVEAETQHLIHSTKVLKNQLDEAKNTTLQMKKESEKSRTHAKKWETELSTKLRSLKEEQKKWTAELETLRRELEASIEINNELRQLVVKSEAEELAAKQRVQSIAADADEVARLRAEVDKLTAKLRAHEGTNRELELERAKVSEEKATTKAEMLELKLKSAENELKISQLETNREMEALREEIEALRAASSSQQPKGFQELLESALSISKSRLADSQRAHNNLLKRFAGLQEKYMALKDHLESDEPLLSGEGDVSQYGSDDLYLSESLQDRRRRRGLSDSDYNDRSVQSHSGHSFGSAMENSVSYFPIRTGRIDTTIHLARPASQHEARSPSQRIASTDLIQHTRSGSADSAQINAAAGVGLDLDANGKPKIKPNSDIRVYGRGGVQNVGQTPKVKKEKKKEDPDKKDKKAGGILGLPYSNFGMK